MPSRAATSVYKDLAPGDGGEVVEQAGQHGLVLDHGPAHLDDGYVLSVFHLTILNRYIRKDPSGSWRETPYLPRAISYHS